MPEIDRRSFLKLAGVSAGAAAAVACSDHVEKLIPYVVPDEKRPARWVRQVVTLTIRRSEKDPIPGAASPR